MNPGAPSSQAFEKLASELVSREHTENLMQAQKSFSQLFTDFLKK
jgi:hypothetical protein